LRVLKIRMMQIPDIAYRRIAVADVHLIFASKSALDAAVAT